MRKRRMLIVDRDSEVGRSIQEFFQDDYEVFFLDDGTEIISTIDKRKIELLLTDIDIPNIYIYNLLPQLNALFPELRIIIMYVYCDYTQEMENTIRRMVDAIYLKPFDLLELKKRIDILLENRLRSNREKS